MRYEIRPLGAWTDPVTADRSGSGRFKAPWVATLDLLAKETEYLGAQLVVLQVDVTEGEIRRDGMLRANAKVDFPGVRVSFDSVHGWLTYATDAYAPRYYGDPPGWQANIRAIALGLGALRAVDRYGVTSKGEQYAGWRAIEAGSGSSFATADEAARWMRDQFEGTGAVGLVTPGEILREPEFRDRVYKTLVRRLHPDVGGKPDDWAKLDQAWQLIGAGAR